MNKEWNRMNKGGGGKEELIKEEKMKEWGEKSHFWIWTQDFLLSRPVL